MIQLGEFRKLEDSKVPNPGRKQRASPARSEIWRVHLPEAKKMSSILDSLS